MARRDAPCSCYWEPWVSCSCWRVQTSAACSSHTQPRGGGKWPSGVRWAQRALVYEEIPLSRMTWPWILKRHFRIGNTFSVSERIIGNRSRLLRRFFIGAARIGLGTVMLPALIVSPAFGMKAIGHVVRGTGMLVGLLGHKHEEYSPTALAREGRG